MKNQLVDSFKLDFLLDVHELEGLDDERTQAELLVYGYLGTDKFPQWFDKSKCPYTMDVIRTLVTYYTDYFDIWWDPKKIPISNYGGLLCTHCNKYFPKWWDPENFPYEHACDALLFCWEYKEIWWDNNPYFRPTDLFFQHLIKHFNKCFDEWWDPDLFYANKGLEYLELFAEYCSEHFDKWWISKRFKRKLDDWELEALIKHCPEHFDKWKKAVPKTIFNKEIIAWFIENHPEFCEKLKVENIPVDLLLKALKSGVVFKSFSVSSHERGEFQFLLSLDKEKITKLQAILDEKFERSQEFWEKLRERGLLIQTSFTTRFSDVFNWSKYTIVLLKDFGEYFDLWWDPEVFPWEKHSKDLCKYLPDKFPLWWDEEAFNMDHAWALVEYCFDYANIWLPIALENKLFRIFMQVDEKIIERLKLVRTLMS